MRRWLAVAGLSVTPGVRTFGGWKIVGRGRTPSSTRRRRPRGGRGTGGDRTGDSEDQRKIVLADLDRARLEVVVDRQEPAAEAPPRVVGAHTVGGLGDLNEDAGSVLEWRVLDGGIHLFACPLLKPAAASDSSSPTVGASGPRARAVWGSRRTHGRVGGWCRYRSGNGRTAGESRKWRGVNTQPLPCPLMRSRIDFSADCECLAMDVLKQETTRICSKRKLSLDNPSAALRAMFIRQCASVLQRRHRQGRAQRRRGSAPSTATCLRSSPDPPSRRSGAESCNRYPGAGSVFSPRRCHAERHLLTLHSLA